MSDIYVLRPAAHRHETARGTIWERRLSVGPTADGGGIELQTWDRIGYDTDLILSSQEGRELAYELLRLAGEEEATP